jgi:hypothetical protein
MARRVWRLVASGLKRQLRPDISDAQHGGAAANGKWHRSGRVERHSEVPRTRDWHITAADQPLVGQPGDLSGRAVHVRRSSSYYESLQALNARLTAAGRPPVRIVEASEHLEDEDLLEMVNAGLIPATVVDSHVASLWAQVFKDIRVHEGAAVRAGGHIAWALRRGTPQLRQVVDEFVATHPKGSLLFNTLFRRYFKNTKWVTNAASEAEVRKFRQMVELFKRYGHQYDFPWLLVAAQAYQESQIDQSRRSPVGAVGVMQIKPSTAAGDPINILGVETSAEKNIQAGIKYLRFIADRYYKNEPMDRLNKGLFSVAILQCGPGEGRRPEASGVNAWTQSEPVVRQRGGGRRAGDRPRNGAVRGQHLQVLRRLHAPCGAATDTPACPDPVRRLAFSRSHAVRRTDARRDDECPAE